MAKRIMASHNEQGGSPKDGGPKHRKGAAPDWADGLRQLYDSVVDEPLPDSFMDLLAQFDDDGDGDPSKGKAGSA